MSKTKVEDITHDEAKRSNIPTSELKSLVSDKQKTPIRVEYEKRNPDLDPQLIWRGKYDGDDTLTVKAPPLYIQEKIHPKALIEGLRQEKKKPDQYLSLFADFNGMPKGVDKTDFYKHEQNWTNRMILGDSLQVMASLAEREGLRGQVQAIYMDPPYGIKFNSNFQWSTNSRDVKDGKIENFTREPEQVKAFRDTWEDGIHSYLSYLRDRFIVARDLLTESGSIFVQIGDENVHFVKSLLSEVFGESNFSGLIIYRKTTGANSPSAKVNSIACVCDYILWYAKNLTQLKYNQIYLDKNPEIFQCYNKIFDYDTFTTQRYQNCELTNTQKLFQSENITSSGYSESLSQPITIENKQFNPTNSSHWKTTQDGMLRLNKANRILINGRSLNYRRFMDDFPVSPINNIWNDIKVGYASDPKIYVVQTSTQSIQRCLLMATDPGDLVLDPTCGSGTTAYVAEQWGRRWITIDTSRVALALARARLMGAKYPYYLMADSKEGQQKESEITNAPLPDAPVGNNINLGFVYERVPHITLGSIAHNTGIDDIWNKWQQTLEPLREKLNKALSQKWEEWEIPREADRDWKKQVQKIHSDWWEARISRQKEIDASIAAKAEFEFLYDKPYEDNQKVRVSGPFTVESISPYRILNLDEDDNIVDPQKKDVGDDSRDFNAMILDNLKTAGIQQSHKEDKISFESIEPFSAGKMITADGRYLEGNEEKRAAIFIGPEFGTVSREDIIEAAREAGDEKFDILVVCAFNFEGNTEEIKNRGYLPILKARMNSDLHMSESLKKTGKGNLFVVFGDPDIEIIQEKDNIRVQVKGVDVYNPAKGEIISDNADDIACWFIDTNYNNESFFVRHAYFLGQDNPYDSLKRALNADIDRDTWESLNSAISRPFPKPETGRIAVKIINHLGDEVMKVFRV